MADHGQARGMATDAATGQTVAEVAGVLAGDTEITEQVYRARVAAYAATFVPEPADPAPPTMEERMASLEGRMDALERGI